MAEQAPTVEELVKCSEEEFDKAIQSLTLKDMMKMIEGLQGAMKKEQANFDSLKEQLESMDNKKSRQCKQISKDIAKSQGQLALLINRNFKCFSLQNDKTKQASTLKRRNSNKGLAPGVPDTKASIHRSHSMHLPTSPTDPSPPPLPGNPPPNADKPPRPNPARPPSGKSLHHVSNGFVPSTKPDSRISLTSSTPALNVVPKDVPHTVNGSSTSESSEEKESLPSVRKLAETFGSMQRRSVPNSIPLKAVRPLSQEVRSSFGIHHSNADSSSKVDPEMTATSGSSSVPGRPAQGYERAKVKTTLTVVPGSKPAAEPEKSEQKIVDSEQVESAPVSVKQMSQNYGEKTKDLTSSSSGKSSVSAAQVNRGSGSGAASATAVPSVDGSKTTGTLEQVSQTSTSKTPVLKAEPSVSTNVARVEVGKSSSAHSDSSRGTKTSSSAVAIESKARAQKNDLLSEIKSMRKDDDAESEAKQVKSVPRKPQEDESRSLSVTLRSISREDVTDAGKGSEPAPPQQAAMPTKTASAVAPAKATGPAAAAGAGDGLKKEVALTMVAGKPESDDVQDLTPRMNLKDWDPIKLLKELYALKLMEETAEDISHKFVHMEGYMEKLPMNKKKATLLKTWKRRFFKAEGGSLLYYETSQRDKPSETIKLMGGKIDDLGNRILGIDDGRGRFLMVRCPSDTEHGQWKLALQSQTEDNTKAMFVRPVLRANPHPEKKVIIVDMGSAGIRAGRLGDQASLPEVFFPTVVAVDNTSGKCCVGYEAYRPEVRARSTIHHPVRPTNKVDKFNIDMQLIPVLFEKVFHDLAVNPKEYWVMLSTPQNLGDSLRRGLMELLVEKLGVPGVCMVQQSLLSLYSYNTNTGVLVDIGERTDILPIYDGFVIEGGVAKLPFGGQRVLDSLNTALLGQNYKFMSPTELLLVRYVMEKSCFVAVDFKSTLSQCRAEPKKFETTVSLGNFDLPPEAYEKVSVDECRFSSPEGLFNTDLWEMDYPNLIKLVSQAIQACPMDSRRHMYRAVYLSGGLTLLPGFSDRLHDALSKIAPPGVPVEVHAAPQRYHAAYVGACRVAAMPEFQMMAVSAEEWRKNGVRCFRKWATPSS